MSITFSWIGATQEQQVNLAQGNAARILDVLGYHVADCVGKLDAADLALRATYVLLDIEARPELDAGDPEPQITHGDNFVWVDCGWEPGYLSQTLTRLRDLAQAAGEYPIEYY